MKLRFNKYSLGDKKIVWEKLGKGKFRVSLAKRDRMVEHYKSCAILLFSFTLVISLFGMMDKQTTFIDTRGPMRLLFMVSAVSLPVSLLLKFGDCLMERIFRVSEAESGATLFLGNLIEEQGLYTTKDGVMDKAVVFMFTIGENSIEITASTSGTGLVEKIRRLDGAFEDKFGMEIISKNDEMDRVTYKLRGAASKDRLYAPVKKSDRPGWLVPVTKDLTWNMNESAHGLIAGSTGGGKTYFIFYLVSHFLSNNFNLYLCDPKRSDLSMAENYLVYKSVGVEHSSGGIARNIRLAKELMLDRYERMAESKREIGFNYSDLGLKPTVLLIDEFGAYLSACDKKLRTEVVENLKQIIFQGRQAGVFVILATQKPDAETVPTAIRDQLGLRAVLGNLSDEGYRMVFGSNEGMEYKSKRAGEGYVYFDGIPSDRPVSFKAPYIDDLNGLIREVCTEGMKMPVRFPDDEF